MKTNSIRRSIVFVLVLFLFTFSYELSAQGTLTPTVDVSDCPEKSTDQLTICDFKKLINNCSDLLGRKIRSNRLKNYSKQNYDEFATAINMAVTAVNQLSDPPDIQKLTASYTALLAIQDSFSNSFKGNSELRFVGTGDVQKKLSEDSQLPANAGFGVTYERDFGDQSVGFSRIQVEASINVASTADSLAAIFDNLGIFANQTDFGSSILVPINSGQAAYFNVVAYFNWDTYNPSKNVLSPGIISGVNFSLIASNRNWDYPRNSRKMTSMVTKVGVFKEFFPFFQRDPDYSITFGVNYTMNKLLGDAALDKTLRMDVLGTEQTTFHGGEIVASIRLKNLKGEIAIPFVKKKNDIDIEGLTGGRLITRIRFTGGFPVNLQ